MIAVSDFVVKVLAVAEDSRQTTASRSSSTEMLANGGLDVPCF